MANITRKRTGEFLQKLFKILIANPDGIQAKEALAFLEQQIQLTDYEKGEFGSGSRRFDKIVRFATIDAVKAGWMRKNKGIWTVTEAGIEALEKFKDSTQFYQEAVRLYRQWKGAQAEDNLDPEEATPEKSVRVTFEESEEQAWTEITEYLTTIDPYKLQDVVAALLEAMGYHIAWTAEKGRDGGIDILAWNDHLGIATPRIKVQVKRRQDGKNISEEDLRSFLHLIGKDEVGIFVTTSRFSRTAEISIYTKEPKKVTLIDREKLVNLWIKYHNNLDKDKKDLLPLKPIYFLSPTD